MLDFTLLKNHPSTWQFLHTGGDLYNRIQNQRGALFPEERVVAWLAQLTCALRYIHSKGILHR